MKYLISIGALLVVSCNGGVEGGQPPITATGGATGSTGGSTTTTMDPTQVGPAAAPFKVRNSTPELLPFDLRVRRVASAIGVMTDNAMFAELHANHIKLGDYDFANSAQQDPSWLANRIAGWMDALKPVCASPEMKAKYPLLPENLPQLIRDAWGHPPSVEEQKDFTDAIEAAKAAGVEQAVVYESTCMAVFSAAEFVYR